MANYRVDLMMGMGDAGWSEVYWLLGSDLSAIQVATVDIAKGRMPLCNGNCRVVGWRIKKYTDDGIPDKANRGLIQEAGPFGLKGNQAQATRDVSAVAVLLRFFDSSGYFRKNLWLRGLPDDSVSFAVDGSPVFEGPLAKAITTYGGVLMAADVQIHQFQRDQTQNPPGTIRDISFSADGVLSITVTAPQPTWLIGKRIKIVDYRGAFGSKVNGLVKITDVDEAGTTFTLAKFTQAFSDQTKSGNGALAFLEKYALNRISKTQPIKMTKHNTGRAFFVTPGRRLDHNPFRITPVALP